LLPAFRPRGLRCLPPFLLAYLWIPLIRQTFHQRVQSNEDKLLIINAKYFWQQFLNESQNTLNKYYRMSVPVHFFL
jgi:hypothetical protein